MIGRVEVERVGSAVRLRVDTAIGDLTVDLTAVEAVGLGVELINLSRVTDEKVIARELVRRRARK